MKTILVALLALNIYANVLEVDQLFNKKIISVKEQQIEISKNFYGKTVIDEANVKDIVVRFDGYITKLFANKEFVYVKKGDPLLMVYSDEVVSLEEELLFANKNSSVYKSGLKKLETLGIDKKEIKKILESNKVVENIRVYSPISGFITTKNINSGSFVKKGKLLLRIVDFSKLWVIGNIYQKDLSFVKQGMKAVIKIDGFNKIESIIDFIYPRVNKKTQTTSVRILIDNKNLKLFPDLFATIQLYKPPRTILTLPKSAVLTKGEEHFVFKPVGDKDYEPVIVEALRLNSNIYEILDGLSKGEKVIDKGLFLLDSDAITNGLYDTQKDEDW